MRPAANDIISFIQFYYDSTLYAGAIFAYDYNCPAEYIGYGIGFTELRQTFVPEHIHAPFGADHYTVYLIGNTKTQVENLAKHLIALFTSTMDMTLNTLYARFWLDYDNAQWLKNWNEIPLNENWRRMATCSVWCAKKEHTGEQILDPRYNTKLGNES